MYFRHLPSKSTMKSSKVFDDCHAGDVLLNDERIPCGSLWIPNISPSFQGTASMVNFEQARGERSDRSRQSESCDDEFESCFQQPPEKKRRLRAEQVEFLEKSFATENKLEPDRKIELARKVGLQPRQVAIWFQNRRARSKTKVLEREYGSLKSCYDKLKADYDALFSDNEKLRNEVDLLSEKLVQKGRNERIRPMACKQEDACSYSSHRTPDLEQGDEDDDSLLQPKLEAQYYEYDDHLQPNSCNLGFPSQNQGTWFWQC